MNKPIMRYHHLGIPTEDPRENESYLPEYGVHITRHKDDPFGIEWMRYEADSPLPELVENGTPPGVPSGGSGFSFGGT